MPRILVEAGRKPDPVGERQPHQFERIGHRRTCEHPPGESPEKWCTRNAIDGGQGETVRLLRLECEERRPQERVA